MGYLILTIIAWVIIIFGLISLISIIYRGIFNRRANGALYGEGGGSFSIEPLPFVLGVVLIVLTILMIISLVKINKLEEKIEKQQGYINNINANVNNLKLLPGRVSSLEDLLRRIEEEQKLIQSYRFNIIEFTDETYAKVNVNIEFSLKELKANSDVYLIATNNDTGEIIKVLLTSEILTFSQVVPLDISANYKVNLQIETGENKTNEFLLDVRLKDIFNNRVELDKKSIIEHNRDNKRVDYHVTIENNTFGIENLKITAGHFKVFNGETLMETIEFTDLEIIESGDFQYISYHGTNTIDKIIDFKVEVYLYDGLGNEYRETITV